MAPDSHGTLLIEEVDRFAKSVRQLALAMVDAVIRQELQHRLDAILESLAPPAEPRRITTIVQPVKAMPEPSSNTKADGQEPQRKRSWTREAIVNELAGWLASGTTIDAAFVSRHGPPALVAATRKIFGRFDAALNVASLQVAKLYPEGPLSRRAALDVG